MNGFGRNYLLRQVIRPVSYTHLGRGLTLEDPEQIALVLQLHRAALALEEEHNSEQSDPQEYTEYLYLDLHYELADGTALERGYSALPIVCLLYTSRCV